MRCTNRPRTVHEQSSESVSAAYSDGRNAPSSGTFQPLRKPRRRRAAVCKRVDGVRAPPAGVPVEDSSALGVNVHTVSNKLLPFFGAGNTLVRPGVLSRVQPLSNGAALD